MRRGEHGGDWAAYQIQYHGMPLDFSANVSPMGIPAGVKRALYQAVEEVNRYPDPLCRQLRACLGRHHDVSSAQILCGNGASDLIDRLVLALRPKRGMVTAPAFSEYGQALRRVGGQVEEFPLQRAEDFRMTARILDHYACIGYFISL